MTVDNRGAGARMTVDSRGAGARMMVDNRGAGARLDVWLAAGPLTRSRAQIQKLIAEGVVLVNGAAVDKNYKIKAGDEVCIGPEQIAPQGFAAQDIAIDVVYEDSHIVVVNKPRGIVTHPGGGNPDGTLANALARHCEGALSNLGGPARPGIVHRLDKDTSGLIVAAKDNETHRKLAEEFKERRVRKIYNAVVYGNVSSETGRIEMRIGRHATDRKRMAAVAEGGRPATTLFKVVKTLRCGCTWLELDLLTGRTHQIRVHLAQIGHPVAGDQTYGRGRAALCPLHGPAGLLLHSTVLEFTHPATGGRVRFESPLPQYFPTE